MDPALTRCRWVNPADALYVAYHDEEWGVPEYDSRALWEKLVLDGFQAGLAVDHRIPAASAGPSAGPSPSSTRRSWPVSANPIAPG